MLNLRLIVVVVLLPMAAVGQQNSVIQEKQENLKGSQAYFINSINASVESRVHSFQSFLESNRMTRLSSYRHLNKESVVTTFQERFRNAITLVKPEINVDGYQKKINRLISFDIPPVDIKSTLAPVSDQFTRVKSQVHVLLSKKTNHLKIDSIGIQQKLTNSISDISLKNVSTNLIESVEEVDLSVYAESLTDLKSPMDVDNLSEKISGINPDVLGNQEVLGMKGSVTELVPNDLQVESLNKLDVGSLNISDAPAEQLKQMMDQSIDLKDFADVNQLEDLYDELDVGEIASIAEEIVDTDKLEELTSFETKEITQKAKELTTIDTEKLYANLGKLKDWNTDNIIDGATDKVIETKELYSKKYLDRVYDSLEAYQLDSLYEIASALAKDEISEDNFLSGIRGIDQVPTVDQFEDESASIRDLATHGTDFDVSSFRLPQVALQELPVLSGKIIPEEYLPYVDSVRTARMKLEKMKLDEDVITENVKLATMKDKVSILDRSYFEGVIAILKDEKVTLIQFSPSLGTHLTHYFSLGAGPMINIEAAGRRISGVMGLRMFAKTEFFEKKVYIQFEDIMNPSQISTEFIKNSKHSFLAGGGGLLLIGRNLAINPAIFYRVNNASTGNRYTSPWVFRLGLSTIKLKK